MPGIMRSLPQRLFAINAPQVLQAVELAGILGWQDIRQRYRRSMLGPFWLSISMGVMVGVIGLVFGQIFRTLQADYLPFLAAGLMLWAFMATVLNEGCLAFIAAEGIIRQLPVPLGVHLLRVIWRNVLILAHNAVVFPLVLLAVGKAPGWPVLLCLPGLVLLTLNLGWLALLLATFCARYRDLPQIVSNFLQVVFYLTPVIWMPALLPDRAAVYLLDLNPAYHLLEIVRQPLLGRSPDAMSWGACALVAVVGWAFALAVFARFRYRVAYWL